MLRVAIVVLSAVLIGTGGCGTFGPAGDSPALDLAPQSSERYQCGPSTLASVLGFHGVEVSEETISEAIYSPTARGVLLADLSRYAREMGFRAEMRTGTLEDLRRAVEEKTPPIVLLDLGVGGYRVPHFTAVSGVTGRGVFSIGQNSEDDFASTNRFERQWRRAGNHYLVILP